MRIESVNHYMVQNKKGILRCFFHDLELGICSKTYKNDRWSIPEVIFKDGIENFSANLGEDDQIYVFCQNQIGNIFLCLYQNESWHTQLILQNQTNSLIPVRFHCLLNDMGLHLFYNLPNESGTEQMLIYQSRSPEGRWSTPSKIDVIKPFISVPFIVQKVNEHHVLVFYQILNKEYTLGYREFSLSQKKWSDLIVFHNTSYQCIDQSFLIVNDAIHVLYALRGMFSYQLVYRRKLGSTWSSPTTLWDGQRIDTCSLFSAHNKLWISWIGSNQVYYCTSENNGQSFSRPTRHQQLSSPVVKGIFQTNHVTIKKNLYLSEFYIKDTDLLELLLLPDVYPEIYHLSEEPPTHKVQEKVSSDISPTINDEYEPSIENSEYIYKMQNQLSMYTKQLQEKEQQIFQFTQLLQEKSNELSELHVQMRELQKERNSLLLKNDELLKTCDQIEVLHSQVNSLETENKNLASLQSELSTYKMQLSTLKTQNQNFHKANKNLQKIIKKQKKEAPLQENLIGLQDELPFQKEE